MPTASPHVIIIGTGLGGLLTGAYLASIGRRVTFVEALEMIGGRFTHIDYQGFAVPTGAFHALPGGSRGLIVTCLQQIGVEVALTEPEPSMQVIWQGQPYPLYLPPSPQRHSGLRRAVGMEKSLPFALRSAGYWFAGWCGHDASVTDWVGGRAAHAPAVRLFDHLTKFSFGVAADDAAAFYVMRSLLAQRFGREAFLLDGNRALVTTLCDFALARDAVLRLKTPVTRIILDQGRAVGVETADGERIPAGMVVSNAGAGQTAKLLGTDAPAALRRQAEGRQPAYGATHAIRCRRRLHAHGSLEIPVDLDTIAGIVPISNICPNLCPPDWHYSLAYQAIDPQEAIAPQVARAHAELKAHLGDDIDIFNSATYYGEHPAMRIAQCVGQYGRRRIAPELPGIKGLFLVGDDAAGYGFAAEIIGYSCLRLWKRWARGGAR